jgi:mRNA interferase HigB
VDVVEYTAWNNPGELKAAFRSAAFVGDLTVFNIGGNKSRMAAFVQYRAQVVPIKRIGTNEEYDKWEL